MDEIPAEDRVIDEFREAVAHAAPAELEVTAIAGGFDVVYREELTQEGTLMRIDSSFRALVRCDGPARTFTLEDTAVMHHSSVAGLQRSSSVFSGRMHATRTVEVVGLRDDGTFGTVDSQRQDTRMLHAAVREPAAALGWTEREPTSAKVGKAVAIVTGAGLVTGAVVVGVVALAGGFS